MDAVNLIPSDARKRQAGVSASPLTLGLIGVLVAVIVCAALYVFALNDVRGRKSELARVTTSATSWQAAANSYTALVTAAQQRGQQLVAVRQLVTGRFPWSQLLSQIGGLMPAQAALSSLQATTPTTTTPSSAGAAPVATGATAPTVTLSGCAASQSMVAQTMVQLHKVSGASSVQLGSSTDSGTGSSPSGSGACPFSVQFNVTLTLAPTTTGTASTTSTGATPAASTTTSATPAAATTTPAAATTTPAAATTTPAAATTTTTGATPAAATTTQTTGASQ
jgi:Tfp pilus assembly protein PilN